jgi:hypothetical protein
MTNKITYELSDYLKETYGNDVSFSIKNASYNTVWTNEKLEEQLEWGDTNSDAKPTWDSIKDDYTAKAEAVNKNTDALQARKSAYPSMAEQLDDIYHNGVDGWKANIKAIKDANPKSE